MDVVHNMILGKISADKTAVSKTAEPTIILLELRTYLCHRISDILTHAGQLYQV